MKYISNVFVDVSRIYDNGKTAHRWQLLKHPNTSVEGENIDT
jgi:hypothetical protein